MMYMTPLLYWANNEKLKSFSGDPIMTLHINELLTVAIRYTPTPLSVMPAGSTLCSFKHVAYITGVGHYRVVGCIGEIASTICGSARITTVDDCN